MAEQKLPTPVVVPEMYLAAILEELRTLNKLLGGATEAPASGEVALKEPAKKPAHRDAKQAAAKVEAEAVGPVTVETVEVVEPKKPIGTERKG